MFCTECGKQLFDGNLFCIYCGTKIENVAQLQPNNIEQTVQTPRTGQNEYPLYKYEQKNQTRKKSKKYLRWLIPSMAFLVVSAIVLVFFLVDSSQPSDKDSSAFVTERPEDSFDVEKESGINRVIEKDYDSNSFQPYDGYDEEVWDYALEWDNDEDLSPAYDYYDDNDAISYEDDSWDSIGSMSDESRVINLWSFTDEIPCMVERYKELNPSFDYDIKTTIIATNDGAYMPALDAALAAGGDNAPDIYAAEAAFVLKYSQGDASGYAATYRNLGIDVDKMISDADIADYVVRVGTRKNDSQVVALAYQSTSGCFIYRRSIAIDVWGTDDPNVVQNKIGGGTGKWDKFFEAAEGLKKKGYAICSGDEDIWRSVENSASKGWIVDGKLFIDPKRESFLDIAKKLKDKGYSHNTNAWREKWFGDMKRNSGVFGYFGPVWLINYTMAPNCGEGYDSSYGDWAVCDSPCGFFWGGTWLFANKNTKAKNGVAELLKWITLDCSKTGLQYYWANGNLYGEGGVKDCVTSGTVLGESYGALDMLSGQNMHEYYARANKYVRGDNVTQYDEDIGWLWKDAVHAYVNGEATREEAVALFRQNVKDLLGIQSDASTKNEVSKQEKKAYIKPDSDEKLKNEKTKEEKNESETEKNATENNATPKDNNEITHEDSSEEDDYFDENDDNDDEDYFDENDDNDDEDYFDENDDDDEDYFDDEDFFDEEDDY